MSTPPLAPIIPIRPDIAAPVARGWHGMSLRSLAMYEPADYAAWIAADPNGNARLIDVAPWSPAALAGIATGDWVTLIDGESPEQWERHGALVGARVRIDVYRSFGLYAVDVRLVTPPRKAPKTRKGKAPTRPAVAPGRHLGPKQRLQWESALYSDPALTTRARDLAVRLAATYANKCNLAWPSRATLARDLGVSTDTIDRAATKLKQRGWLKLLSGRQSGVSNRYWLTWPAGL